MVAAVRRLGRAIATPSGGLAILTGAAGLWAVAGLAGARIVAAVAVVFGVALLLHLAHDANVRAREAVARAKAARDVADQSTRRVHQLNKGNARLQNENRRLTEKVERMQDQLTDTRRRLRAAERDVARGARAAFRAQRTARAADAASRESAAAQRRSLTSAIGPVDPQDRWPTVDSGVADPRLSIVVAGSDRPESLRRGLDALLPQLDRTAGDVELVVVDDASTDRRVPELAHDLATTTEAVGFHRNPTPLGLEHRRIAVGEICSGAWLWVLDDDEIVAPGAVETVLADIAAVDRNVAVLLYAVTSVDVDGGSVASPAGTEPINLDPGESHTFSTLIELGHHPGIASTAASPGRVIVRRDLVTAVDPSPYLGLTMAASAAVLVAAAARAPVHYRNTAVVTSPVLTRAQAVIEAAGRPEESFAAGGSERDMRWFGAGYAAMLHRLTTHTDLEPDDFLGHVERRWTDDPLIDWIEHNWTRATRRGVALRADIIADAEAFFAAIGRPAPTQQQE